MRQVTKKGVPPNTHGKKAPPPPKPGPGRPKRGAPKVSKRWPV